MEGSFPNPVQIPCKDGVVLGGHLWTTPRGSPLGTAVINPATGVLARYYHRYAAFLTNYGFDALTYDYRGIGLSRPTRLRGCSYIWRDWGEQDFEAALRFAHSRNPEAPLLVVGHSIGGFLPGLAPSGHLIHRMLTVGAQYAYWRDYAPERRLASVFRWHIVMPLLTALCGYFPGKRLGWLEDLPAGVANEWSFGKARRELSYPERDRRAILERIAQVTAPILAVSMTDDEFGTVPGITRGLAYYRQAPSTLIRLSPSDIGQSSVGHFGLFHSRHESDFWRQSLIWLRDGINPWCA